MKTHSGEKSNNATVLFWIRRGEFNGGVHRLMRPPPSMKTHSGENATVLFWITSRRSSMEEYTG